MGKHILVIGGTRYFGRLLVKRLLDAGHRVSIATRGNAADDFGDRVLRIRVDRGDPAAMAAAFVDARYDVVYDQMCYSPLDAAISTNVFAGKVQRYVMASTIEVYRHLYGQLERPFDEGDIDLAAQPIDLDHPWRDAAMAEENYAIGKRQAEAFFHQDGRLPVVSVRIGHVLSGPEDFTGRLADYVTRVGAGRPLRHSAKAAPSAFIDAEGIADFLVWVGCLAGVLGPVNAASNGPFSAVDLHRRVASVLGEDAAFESIAAITAPCELSPFDFGAPYAMSTQHADVLGYRFSHTDDWLDATIARHVPAHCA